MESGLSMPRKEFTSNLIFAFWHSARIRFSELSRRGISGGDGEEGGPAFLFRIGRWKAACRRAGIKADYYPGRLRLRKRSHSTVPAWNSMHEKRQEISTSVVAAAAVGAYGQTQYIRSRSI